mmetsp:Transcript_17005/g.24710  ORF Transcript_17005/g.24710 Transcript_17005/m.24710 type:complete len:80 (+) Transcript_17005:561-800(+)
MLTIFPSNLEIPVNAPFLRRVMRRKRLNDNKCLKNKVEPVLLLHVPLSKKAEKKLALNLPFMGKMFPSIVYNKSDFNLL